MAHIAVLTHRNQNFERWGYFLHGFMDIWREAGHRVSVLPGPDGRASNSDVDLAIPHIDLTVTPPDFLEWSARFPRLINGRITDISKRAISRALVTPGDGYSGPVFVKTDRNHGGLPEARMAATTSPLRRCANRLHNRLPWRWRSSISSMDYRVFDSPAAVPRAVWTNRNFVVERFQPEMKDGLYCLRIWVFLGDRETNIIAYSQKPVVKSINIIRREPAGEVPAELRQMRKDLGFDFGKFDYAIVNGRVVLYDANRTPVLPNAARDQYRAKLIHLAEGIQTYL